MEHSDKVHIAHDTEHIQDFQAIQQGLQQQSCQKRGTAPCKVLGIVTSRVTHVIDSVLLKVLKLTC